MTTRMPTYRCLSRYTPDMFCSSVLEHTAILNEILDTDNVNLQTNIINNVLNNCINKCAPFVTKKITRPSAPWMNDTLKLAIKNRNEFNRQLKLDRYNVALQTVYKEKKKCVKSEIHKAKTKYFQDEFKKCGKDRSKMWKIVKQLIPDGSKTVKSQFENNTDKAESFNDFFSDVGRVTYRKTQESVYEAEYQPILEQTELYQGQYFRPSPINVETLILTVKQLNETSAVGADDIGYRFVIDSLPVTSFYLTVCVNTSIVTGEYPSVWQHALVTPVFKSGDPDEITNYRPISILPVLSKIIEKVVANQLVEYLEINNFLSNTQHGFRRGLSTETALIKVVNEIYDNMDRNKITLLTLCDLSKAFDSVHHELLLSKLCKVKVDPFWFKSYLSGRTQSVKINNTISSEKDISFGVPQGSIIGPILFLIFVNDMAQIATGCSLVQFADDSQFIHTGTVDKIDELVKAAELTLLNAK